MKIQLVAPRAKKPSFLFGLATLLAALALAALAGPAAAQSRPQLVIVQAEADLPAETLLIRGENFIWANDNQAVVTLAGNPLAILSIDAGHILAQLPPAVAPGGYLLKVSRGSGAVQNGTFAFTLGAVGPEGPQGPRGPMGDTGPQGLPGATGATGPRGATGSAGPQGPQGVPGIQGLRGLPGLPGQQGVPGPAGPQLVSFDALAGLACTVSAQPGTLSISYAADGVAQLKCNTSGSCETSMDTCVAACCNSSSFGSFTGDSLGCAPRVTRSEVGEGCFTITLREDDAASCAHTEGTFRLHVPPGVDMDLVVTVPPGAQCEHFVESTNSFEPGCTGNNGLGQDETVFVVQGETCPFGQGDSMDQTITPTVEVRWFSGSSCSPWTLELRSGSGC